MTEFPLQKQSLIQKKMLEHTWLFRTATRAGLGVLVVVFGLLYLVEINSISTKGYDINDLEKNVRLLERENEKLEVEIASFSSMNSIQTRLQGMNFVPADDIKYVSVQNGAVARR